MKWLKQRPQIKRRDLIIMNFNNKNKIHRNVRLRRKGFYVFKVFNEFAVIGEVEKPCTLGNVEGVDLKADITIYRNIKELHDLVKKYFNKSDDISGVEKDIVKKILQLAQVESKKKPTDFETNTWWRMCCLWDKIRVTEENK